jgi:hypothetical protein
MGAAVKPFSGGDPSYLNLLRALGQLEDPPALFGGFAEDALLAGTITRPHADLDLLIPRPQLSRRLEQFRALGFASFESYFDEAPGRPLVLHAKAFGLDLELGIINVTRDGTPWFMLPDPVTHQPYYIELPRDTFTLQRCLLDDVTVWCVPPLALYQMRAGIARTGAFGRLRAHDSPNQMRLRAAFWPTVEEAALQPVVRLGGEPPS